MPAPERKVRNDYLTEQRNAKKEANPEILFKKRVERCLSDAELSPQEKRERVIDLTRKYEIR